MGRMAGGRRSLKMCISRLPRPSTHAREGRHFMDILMRMNTLLENIGRFRFRHWMTLAAAGLCLGLAAEPKHVLAGENEPKARGAFSYQPYSEAEINAALQRPLKLQDCIGVALAKNLSLKQAKTSWEQAKALHAGSFGIFLPVLSAEGVRANNYVDLPDTLGSFSEAQFGHQSSVTANVQLFLPLGTLFEYKKEIARDAQFPRADDFSKSDERAYTITVSQPLLRGAGPRIASSKVISAGYQRRLLESAFANEQAQTVFNIKRAYYDVLLQRQLLQVNLSAARNDSALAVASEALVIARLAQRRDVLSAQIRAADSRAGLIKSATDYQTSLDLLKNEMGVAIEQELQLAPDSLKFVPVRLDEQALLQSALQQNPSLQALAYEIKNAKLSRSLANNAALPQVDVFAAYVAGHEKDRLANTEVLRTRGWTAGVNVSYNFLSREARGEAQSAHLALVQQEDRYAALQREITLSIREIVRNTVSSAAEVEAIERSIAVAEQKLEFARAMFNLGRASNFDVTDAQEFLLKAQNAFLRKLVAYYSDLALLEALTGQAIIRE